ncbi:hypothetical protein [Paraburkholderia sp. JHI869]|uniref:hypothetical protein n=1 Tax=Paraburkholderia sp. JHI869 TaxID=3112959 RepID=UPI00317ADB53
MHSTDVTSNHPELAGLLYDDLVNGKEAADLRRATYSPGEEQGGLLVKKTRGGPDEETKHDRECER